MNNSLTIDFSGFKYSVKHYAKNSIIFNEGEECKYVAYILKGSLKISSLSYSDKEYVITEQKENSFVGNVLIFSNDTRYLGDCVAISDVDLILLSKKEFLNLLSINNNYESYLSYLANETLSLRNKLKLYSKSNIRERILFYLKEEKQKTNSNVIHINSKEELAVTLNIPRPSLSRELINMSNDKLISFNRKTITIMI